MQQYRGVVVAPNSALAEALTRSQSEAKKVFAETTARYEATYPKADREWFATMSTQVPLS